MSLLGKMFGNEGENAAFPEKNAAVARGEPLHIETELAPKQEAAPEQTAEPLAVEPQGIRAFDQYGREVMVPREEWRTKVLPGMLQEHWNQPESLYVLILNSLNDGFFPEVAEVTEHLYATDPLPARGASTWGVVLLALGRIDEAQRVLEEFTEAHGEDGSVLVNLAKVYAVRGEQERAEATLWRGLEVEPNLDHGLGWFASIAQERGGEAAAAEALARVAQMPKSWRAQLWLARVDLNRGNFAHAQELYAESLARAPKPVAADLLMQMSGDLGGHGRLAELIEFTAPHFVPEVHGMPVGNNLIKAYFDLGDLDAADAIRRALDALNRPDWKAALTFWQTEISKLRGGVAGSVGDAIQIGMLRVDGTLWLPPGSAARSLFGVKAAGPSVTFLGGSAEAPQPPTPEQSQMGDALGRMTRALPLFLAEQTEMRSAAAGRAMLPWAQAQTAGQPSGFVVSAAPWPDATAVQAASDAANRSDYVVTVHVDAETEPWTALLAFMRTSDGTRIGELQAEFTAGNFEEALCTLADEVVELLSVFGAGASPAAYVVPAGQAFAGYLAGLEQLLAVRCAGMEGVPTQFLEGESAILDSRLELCLIEPGNIAARLLLLETFAALSRVKPEATSAFRAKLDQLRIDSPMPELDANFG